MDNLRFFSEARILFVVKMCVHCNVWKSFIETINLKLPVDKRIKIVDCTRYYEYGIIDDPLILKFKKKIDGIFPKLFLDGHTMEGSIEKDLVETYIKTLLIDEFIIQQHNRFIHNADCDIIKKGSLKNKIQCN